MWRARQISGDQEHPDNKIAALRKDHTHAKTLKRRKKIRHLTGDQVPNFLYFLFARASGGKPTLEGNGSARRGDYRYIDVTRRPRVNEGWLHVQGGARKKKAPETQVLSAGATTYRRLVARGCVARFELAPRVVQ